MSFTDIHNINITGDWIGDKHFDFGGATELSATHIILFHLILFLSG